MIESVLIREESAASSCMGIPYIQGGVDNVLCAIQNCFPRNPRFDQGH